MNKTRMIFFCRHAKWRSVLHGDRAVVQITRTKRDGRKEGRLVEVLERHNQHIIGRYHEEQGFGYVMADNKRIHQDIFIAGQHKLNAIDGQIVNARLIEQPTKNQQPIGEIVEVLGEHMAPGMGNRCRHTCACAA